MKPPFERFLEQALSDFERHLTDERLKAGPIELRMRGAEQFALFLIGRPHRKGKRTRGMLARSFQPLLPAAVGSRTT